MSEFPTLRDYRSRFRRVRLNYSFAEESRNSYIQFIYTIHIYNLLALYWRKSVFKNLHSNKIVIGQLSYGQVLYAHSVTKFIQSIFYTHFLFSTNFIQLYRNKISILLNIFIGLFHTVNYNIENWVWTRTLAALCCMLKGLQQIYTKFCWFYFSDWNDTMIKILTIFITAKTQAHRRLVLQSRRGEVG